MPVYTRHGAAIIIRRGVMCITIIFTITTIFIIIICTIIPGDQPRHRLRVITRADPTDAEFL